MKNFILIGLMLTGLVVALSGCGGSGVDLGPGGSVTAPYDATIDISPDNFTVSDGTPLSEHETEFLIRVTDMNGIPLSDVEVWIDFIWAQPDPDGVVKLYDGRTNEEKDSPMSGVTDVDGTYLLKFVFLSGETVPGVGMSYNGDIMVRSGGAEPASATFTVE